MIFLKEKSHAFIKSNFRLMIKYSIVSVAYYLYVFAFIYLLIDVCSVNVTVSYIITYGLAYLSEHYINIRLLFKVTPHHMMFIKYVIHVVFFLFFGSAMFTFFFSLLGVSIYAMCATIACLFPLRFLSYRLLVYK